MNRVSTLAVLAAALVVAAGCEKKLPAPQPDTVLVTLAPADVSADSGATVASALVTERRVPLEGFSVSFGIALVASSGANPTYADVTAVTDVNGIATVDLSGLNRTGAGAVTATAMREVSGGGFEPYLDDDDQPVAGSAPIRVFAGAAASVSVSLAPAVVDPANGDFLDVSYEVRDGQGNLTGDPVEISTDHPGATVLGARLENLTAAGAWTAAVSVAGRPSVSDSENFSVLPGTASIIDAWLSNTTTDAYADPMAHAPVTVWYRVTDASGNDVTAGSNVVCGIDVLSGGAVNAGIISPLVVKGTFPVTCSLLDGANNLVSSDSETLTVVDLTPPAVTITAPADGATFASGENFTVQVRGQDVVAVSQLTAQLVGLGQNDTESRIVASLSTDVTIPFGFTAGDAGSFSGTQAIYAMGADGSGNLSTAAPVTINVRPFSILAAGIDAALVREDAAFNNPVAIAVMNTAADPVLAVADPGAGGGTIWTVAYDRTNGTSTRSVFASPIGTVRGVEWDRMTNVLWASVDNTIQKYDASSGALLATITLPGGSAPEHLVLGDAPWLYVAARGNDEILRIDTTNDGVQLLPYAIVAGCAGIEYDAVTGSLFVSDFGGGARVYELTPDGNVDGMADAVNTFMDAGTVFGPDPNDPRGLAYKGAGGTYANQLLVANDGNAEIYNGTRDGVDANTFSDAWSTFLRSTRTPRDLAFHANGNLYVLFNGGGGLDAHIVELSGF